MTPWESIIAAHMRCEETIKYSIAAAPRKTCTLCNKTLPITDFYFTEHKTTSRCKPCYRSLVKQRTEKLNASSRQVSGLST